MPGLGLMFTFQVVVERSRDRVCVDPCFPGLDVRIARCGWTFAFRGVDGR